MEIPIKVVVHRSRSAGGFWAQVPAMPGCLTEAETMEELRSNIQEAILGCFEAGNMQDGEPDEDDDGPLEVFFV